MFAARGWFQLGSLYDACAVRPTRSTFVLLLAEGLAGSSELPSPSVEGGKFVTGEFPARLFGPVLFQEIVGFPVLQCFLGPLERINRVPLLSHLATCHRNEV